MSSKRPRIDTALSRHLKRILPIVQEAALEAGVFLKSKYRRFKMLAEKPNAGLVTEADHGAEKIILKILKKHFPQDHFMAEETGKTQGQESSAFVWHIDPLDGTTNFVHGFPLFCVSIGLELVPNNSLLGVIYQPMSGDMYYGYRNGGSYLNGKRMHVSKIKKVMDALLTTGFSYRQKEFLADELESFGRVVHASRGIRRTGSAALDLAFLASGQLDGFWERGLSSWDVCAGIALLTEAGGRVTDFLGSRYSIGGPEILASNTLIHKELQKLLLRTCPR